MWEGQRHEGREHSLAASSSFRRFLVSSNSRLSASSRAQRRQGMLSDTWKHGSNYGIVPNACL
jgi:hypothetical protein